MQTMQTKTFSTFFFLFYYLQYTKILPHTKGLCFIEAFHGVNAAIAV